MAAGSLWAWGWPRQQGAALARETTRTHIEVAQLPTQREAVGQHREPLRHAESESTRVPTGWLWCSSAGRGLIAERIPPQIEPREVPRALGESLDYHMGLALAHRIPCTQAVWSRFKTGSEFGAQGTSQSEFL